MCGAVVCNSNLGNDEDSNIEDECYILEAFLDYQFEPLEWTHLLATLECTNEAIQVKFCNEEGHGIQVTSLNMIKVHYPQELGVVQAAYHKLVKKFLCGIKLYWKEIIEEIVYDASLEKSDDKLKHKGNKKGQTGGRRKLGTKKLNLLTSRSKKIKKDTGTQEESQTPCVTNKHEFLELVGQLIASRTKSQASSI